MKDTSFQQFQSLELKRLLGEVGDGSVMAMQLRARLANIETSPVSDENSEPPRTAIFIRGDAVQGTEGIRPKLAGEALIQFEKMFTEQALHDEREVAKSAGRSRRPHGAGIPGLLFTGTPRGSFGLEFVPMLPDDAPLREGRVKSLDNVSDAIVRVATADEATVDTAIGSVPTAVLQPMKLFMKTLAKHGAELRLAHSDRSSQSLTTSQITTAFERLDREVTEEEVVLPGTFRGLTLQTGYFDFRLQDGAELSGVVGGELSETDLLQIHARTNHACEAILRKTTIRLVAGQSQTTYVLLGARDLPVDPTQNLTPASQE
jgi:hypothetical protein